MLVTAYFVRCKLIYWEQHFTFVSAGPSSGGFLQHAFKCQVLSYVVIRFSVMNLKTKIGIVDCNEISVCVEQDPDRACYGPKHVEVAHERMAIQTLLITDELFRLVILEIVLVLDI